MKRILLLAALVAQAASAASTLSITFAGVTASPGGTALGQVILNTVSGSGPVAMQFSVGVPMDVTSVSGSIGQAASGVNKQISCSPINGGSVTCIIFDLGTETIPNGTVAQMGMFISPKTTAISETVSLGNALGTDGKGTAIPITSTTPVTFPLQNQCDLNNDGVINLSDVLIVVVQALVGPCTTGDLNKDGACNVLDVQRVVGAAVGGACKVGP